MPFLPNSQIEIINAQTERGKIRHALFDFDGTISLLREGWPQVMIPMMVEFLTETPRHESKEELTAVITAMVERTTGQQSIYQMIELCKEIEKRDGRPLDPLEYKRAYLQRLRERIDHRISGVKSGAIPQTEMTVPGAVDLLQNLRARDVTCYLASGTDHTYVADEAGALGVSSYFNGGIYGAIDDYKSFSKAILIANILKTHCLQGAELVVFGDGPDEIENGKAVGGIAVGLATDEANPGRLDEVKRARLMRVGADMIIPDFHECQRLIRYLYREE
jgi:phosphoglycolate phosphatase-like HAD superfamily hydrolase